MMCLFNSKLLIGSVYFPLFQTWERNKPKTASRDRVNLDGKGGRFQIKSHSCMHFLTLKLKINKENGTRSFLSLY